MAKPTVGNRPVLSYHGWHYTRSRSVSKRRIDPASPLYGVTPEDLLATNSTVVVTLSGVDETVTQMMYARHTYAPQDIFWNYRFVDMVSKAENGDRSLDYKLFNDVVPIEVVDEVRAND